MRLKKNEGFSLLEILIIVVVLSLMITISYLVVPPLIDKAHDANRKADLHKIKIELENYYYNKGEYPRSLPDCGQSLVVDNKTLLSPLPCDPVTHESYYYQTKGGESQSYRLYALLANVRDNSISEAGCLGGCGPDCAYNYGVSSSNVGLIRCSYVCTPGGGREGYCELYNDPTISLCPVEYFGDSTCRNECGDPKNRCQNASGKHISY